LDGDYSDYPEELTKLIDPILTNVDFVIGARVPELGNRLNDSTTNFWK
jgi:hypothetical protein